MFSNSNQEIRNIFSGVMFRSSFYALAGYFIALLLEKMIMFGAGAIFGYSLNFNYEYLRIKGSPGSWDQDTVLVIYLFPYFIFALLIVWLFLNNQKRGMKPEFRQIFFMWLMLFFTYRIIGILPAHLIADTGIHYALEWLFLGRILTFIIGISSGLLFIFAASRLVAPIIITYSRMNNYLTMLGWKNLVLASVVFPFALCCSVAILFFTPGLPKEEILGLAFLALPIIYVFIRFLFAQLNFSLTKYKSEERFRQGNLLLMVLVLIGILRIILAFGIKLNWPV